MPFGTGGAKSPEVVMEAPAKKGWVLYQVKNSETLSEIASRYQVDVRSIQWSNDLEKAIIKPGQVLRIPMVEAQTQETRLPPGIQAYRVRQSDTIASVAKRFGLSAIELISANPGVSSLDNLAEGSRLLVPGSNKGLILKLAKGETLLDISSRFGLSLMLLVRANGVENPTDLSAGDHVLIPGVRAKTTYERLLQVQAAERKALVVEQKRLAEERRQRAEEERKLAEVRRQEQLERARTQRQERLAAERKAQELARAKRARTAQSRVRRAQFGGGGYGWPVGNFVITTYFGRRSPYQRFHTGVDLAAPYGTPIYAARGGQVDTAGWSPFGYGIHIQIAHGNGVETLYGHMSRMVVRSGQWVDRGQLIGYVGSTGWSTGPHVHFEVRVGGVARNPMAYLR
jgi:murein DD-endopeptidase MepM/ murein hydrolase activator NlpD